MKGVSPFLLAVWLPSTSFGQESLSKGIPSDAGSPDAPVLFCIGMHIEPHGGGMSKLVKSGIQGNGPGARGGKGYKDVAFFRRHAADIRTVAEIVEAHQGKLTIQAQTPFTQTAAELKEMILGEMEKRGHEIALHFHEDAHMGRTVNDLTVETWTAVLKEEIEWIRKAGGQKIRYWSGGNLYPGVLEAAVGAKLNVMGDYKNPKSQESDPKLLTVFPWRPSKGPKDNDVGEFAKHSAAGKVIYLPSGLFGKTNYGGRRRSEEAGGDAKYFDFLTEGLEASLRAARKDRVNVFHITVHAGEFKGRGGKPFAVISEWLTKVIDPLVRDRKARWATFTEMADEFLQWEKGHPNVDPRETGMAPRPHAETARRRPNLSDDVPESPAREIGAGPFPLSEDPV